PRLGFRAQPGDIGMVVLVNAAATVAMVASLQRRTAGRAAGRGEAIDRFGQGARHGLQFLEPMAGKQIGVRQAVAFQAALQHLDDPGLFWKIGKHHSRPRASDSALTPASAPIVSPPAECSTTDDCPATNRPSKVRPWKRSTGEYSPPGCAR